MHQTGHKGIADWLFLYAVLYAKGEGSLTTWNDEGKIDVSSEGPLSGVSGDDGP